MNQKNIYELITLRKSVRSYKSDPVPDELIRKLLEAARLSPSASNRQEWRFIIVTDTENRRQIADAACRQRFVAEAPVIIICCAKPDGHIMTCGQPSYPIDVAIAIDHITLCAVEEGLGTCWIGAFYEDEVKKILNIPKHIRVVELLTLGYPKNPGRKIKDRLPLEKIVKFEKWK
jgi:nitroreductase